MNMKEKAKAWWNKPITNGDQVMASLKGMAVSAVMMGGLAIVGKIAEKRAAAELYRKITDDYVNEEDITG